MANSGKYELPAGLYEIFDLHPDQLAKYNIGGDGPPGFEIFMTYGLDFVNKYLDQWLPWQHGNILSGDPGALTIVPLESGWEASEFMSDRRYSIYPTLDAADTKYGLPSDLKTKGIYEIKDVKDPDWVPAGSPTPKPRTTGFHHGDEKNPQDWGVLDSAFAELGYTHASKLIEDVAAQAALGAPDATEILNILIGERFNVFIKETEARVNTVLEERSFLDFEFPNTKWGRRRVAFFENPEISESRTPTYAKQPIMQRNEPARLFTGASPRRVNLRFNFTLPLVEEFLYKSQNKPAGWLADVWVGGIPGIPGALGIGFPSTTRKLYIDYLSRSLNHLLGEAASSKDRSAGADSQVIGLRHEQWEMSNTGKKGPTWWEGTDKKVGISTPVEAEGPMPILLNAWSHDSDTMTGPLMDAIAYTHFVLDTVRSSVIGDHLTNTNEVYGPPVVRLRHGTLFEQSPFIVNSYNIEFDHTAGMDVRTLLPRRIRFTLELEEYHQTTGAAHGDFNEPLPGASEILYLNGNTRKYEGKRRVEL